MKTLKDAFQEVTRISRDIEKLVKETRFEEYDDLSALSFSLDDPDHIQLWDEMKHILDRLNGIRHDVAYLNKGIIATGNLYKNSNGRYEACGREFSSGSLIEALIDDGLFDSPRWEVSRIEHNGSDYYLYGHKEINLSGLEIRIRG